VENPKASRIREAGRALLSSSAAGAASGFLTDWRQLCPTDANFETRMTNLFQDLNTSPDTGERILWLRDRPGLRIERIVSTGHASAPGFWYDQAEHEWVVVLQGSAQLTVDMPEGWQTVHLIAGDSLELPAHRRHRVESTCVDPPTLWLALFWPADAP
jgi:cupin 2 domain-containing protein